MGWCCERKARKRTTEEEKRKRKMRRKRKRKRKRGQKKRETEAGENIIPEKREGSHSVKFGHHWLDS